MINADSEKENDQCGHSRQTEANRLSRSFPKNGCSIAIDSGCWPVEADFQVKNGSAINGVWMELEGWDFPEAEPEEGTVSAQIGDTRWSSRDHLREINAA